jgi:hypothetical protein
MTGHQHVLVIFFLDDLFHFTRSFVVHGLVRPLEMAAHPVETVAYAGKHDVLSTNSSKSQFCNTHVSFEPPP